MYTKNSLGGYLAVFSRINSEIEPVFIIKLVCEHVLVRSMLIEKHEGVGNFSPRQRCVVPDTL